jgi:hypothetical protein
MGDQHLGTPIEEAPCGYSPWETTLVGPPSVPLREDPWGSRLRRPPLWNPPGGPPF